MVTTDRQEGIPEIDMAITTPKVCHVDRCHHIRLPGAEVLQESGTEALQESANACDAMAAI